MSTGSPEELCTTLPAVAAHCFTERPDNFGNSECGDIVESVITYQLNLGVRFLHRSLVLQAPGSMRRSRTAVVVRTSAE